MNTRTMRSGRRPAGGFTILEMVVSLSILGALVGAAALFQARGQKASTGIQREADIERRANRIMQAVVAELLSVGVHTLVPDPTGALGTDSMTFQTPLSVSNAGVVAWSPPTSITLQMDTGEIENGLDDDSDGLVDERVLVITHDIGTPSEMRVVIGHEVANWLQGETPNLVDDNGNGVIDEHGFSLQRVGDLLYVRLTVESPVEGGAVTTYTITTALVIHN
jgi:prepilin-type N-terminal cleavage/methylation domain-containing protein